MLLVDAILYLLAGGLLISLVYRDHMRNNLDWANRPVFAQAIALIIAISFWPLLLAVTYYRARVRKQ